MRIVLLISISVLIVSCSLFKKKNKNQEVSEIAVDAPVAEKEPKQVMSIEIAEASENQVMMAYHEVCDVFLAALQSGSSENIEALFPDAALAKFLSPAETSELTDAEIKDKMINGLVTRFKENLNKLKAAANENNVDLSALTIRNCLYFDSGDPETVPRVLSVEFGSETKLYKVPITVLDYNKKTYVFEILKTTGIFDE